MALDTPLADSAAPSDAALDVAIFHPHSEASWSLWLHRQVEHLGLRPRVPLRTLAAALAGPIGADIDALHARLREASPPRWHGGWPSARRPGARSCCSSKTRSAAVGRLARGFSRLPDDPRLRGFRPEPEVARRTEERSASVPPPTPLPEPAAGANPCPQGWSWRRSVPAHPPTESGPLDGVTTCLPEGGRGESDRLVFVALPQVRARVRLRRVEGAEPAAGLAEWVCAGELGKVGVSNLGWTAWRLQREQPEVVVADGDGRVRMRAVVSDDGEGE